MTRNPQQAAANLAVAVVGAGPAGLYVAEALLRQTAVRVRVDVFDRLPTPFGLLRYGVAPDHLKMKSLATTLQRTLDDERVRFFGNVEIGVDLQAAELRMLYDAVIYTFGASRDRELGIPGEGLFGSSSASAFVGWYSGHPDAKTHDFDLSDVTSAVVVGAGNVALDVSRILLKEVQVLSETDIPLDVTERLRTSAIQDVHLLSRRGPAQAKFTHKELAEFGELVGVDVVVDPQELALEEGDVSLLETRPALARNARLLRQWSERPLTGAPRRVHLHFWSRPVALVGSSHLQSVAIQGSRPSTAHNPASHILQIPAQLLVRAIGYRGLPLPGVPFDESSSTVSHRDGRVQRAGETSMGEYVAGWIGRGATGVVGTNKADAESVVDKVLEDLPHLVGRSGQADVLDVMQQRGLRHVDVDGWSRVDRAERELGARHGRARIKLDSWCELMAAAQGGPQLTRGNSVATGHQDRLAPFANQLYD